MNTLDGCVPDVLQVCRNGHVITDLLRTFPERGLSHCDRCGAATLDHCATCGQSLPGAVYVPGLVPVGRPQPPRFCPCCGAAFPWTQRPSAAAASPLTVLENLLRRLPLVIRQLRSRHGDRPPFRVEDEHDLADLLRALLPLHFDDVRLESRTPSYAADTRTDLRLALERIALVVKRTSAMVREPQLTEQLAEDGEYHARECRCDTLVMFVADTEARLPEPHRLETAWSQPHDELEVRCIIVQ
jgi:hypothetical protein